MTAKQISGIKSTDGSLYVCLTDGASNLVATGNTMTTGATKKVFGSHASDGSLFVTFTDGAGNLK